MLVAALACLLTLLVPVASAPSPASAAAVPGGPELVSNPSLEEGATEPTCFSRVGWGTPATGEAVPGRTGARAIALTLSGHTEGDAKLIQQENAACAPVVLPGKSYQISLWYRSTAPVALTLFRRAGGSFGYWGEVRSYPAAAGWTRVVATTPVIPEGTERLSFGLSLGQNGTVVTDDYSARLLSEAPADPAGELVANPFLTEDGDAGMPACFALAGWDERTVSTALGDQVPAGSPTGARSYRTSISDHRSGDAKLLTSEDLSCAPSVQPERSYRVAVQYRSDLPVTLSLFRHTAEGWSYWQDAATLPASPGFTTGEAITAPLPAGTDRLAWGVTLAGDGTLDTTGYSLKAVPEEPVLPPGDPALMGSWSVSATELPVRAIHSTLLKDGRLLLIAGSGNDGNQFAAGTFRSVVWNPTTGVFKQIPTPYDMFCAGHVTLPDGKVLLAGGTAAFPGAGDGPNTFKSSPKSYYFDPKDDSCHRVSDMPDAHWYPSLTKLGNGDIWAAGGLNANAQGTVATQMFNTKTRSWLPLNQVPQTYTYWGTYPHMFLLDDGTLFYSGAHTFGNGRPGTGSSLYDWRTASVLDVPGLREKDMRDQAGSVFIGPVQDQRVMIVGGGNTDGNRAAINLVDIVDLKAQTPSYTAGPDLPGPGKLYVNLVNLADRTVLASNGSQQNRSQSVRSAALYAPDANAWTSISPDPVPRNYHSSAILLPDGRVAVLGSNPADNSFELRISLYSPPYLFKGTRPTITQAPSSVTAGRSFALQVTGDVVKAQLIAPLSATHQTDTNARLIDLPISGTGTRRTAQLTANRNLVPPGPYMLTVSNARGVPSVARWVWVL
ncbi:DUF1929 domain-containing protein [Galactobacter valiniphilus]|uniref:DUF1929 domain-containing protein n=1 Tax=Galactobacter valiniphilus TaxID=2676122 RepID=A0A399JCN9_9MICC|nr:DUF1929 domain-containing protein [Galactobacter valiniphilus]